MQPFIYEKFVLAALLVYCFNVRTFARKLEDTPAVYEVIKSGDPSKIEDIFSEVLHHSDAIKTSYDAYTDNKISTICWNEITTLHFYNNGSSAGFVECSISLVVSPESTLDESDDAVTEQYEVYNDETRTTKILDFVTSKNKPEETVKQNKTVLCKSDKSFLKIFNDFGTKQKIEIRLKSESPRIQFNLVNAQKTTSEEAQTRYRTVHQPESSETVTSGDARIVSSSTEAETDNSSSKEVSKKESLSDGKASKESEDIKKSSETTPTFRSTMYETEEEEEEEEEEDTRDGKEKHNNIDDTQNTSKSDSEVEEEKTSYERNENKHSIIETKDTAFTEPTKDKSSNVEEKISQFQEDVDPKDDNNEIVNYGKESSETESTKEAEGSMTTRKLHTSSGEDHGCSTNKKVTVKMHLAIEDDAGKIDEINKNIEIDLESSYLNGPRSGNFDEELTALIRDYYSDVLQKHKLCPKSPKVAMRSFIDTSNEYDRFYPSNSYFPYLIRPPSTMGSFYVNPTGNYYVVPRKLDGVNDNQESLLKKISSSFGSALQKLFDK